MLYDILKTAVMLTASLSEFTLLFNIWIISPIAGRNRVSDAWLLPSNCSVLFAISEPLYIYWLARIPLEPVYLAFMVPVVQAVLFFTFREVRDFERLKLECATKEPNKRSMEDREVLEASLSAHQSNSIAITCVQDPNARAFWAFAVAHVQTAAATTASLLLAAQNLDVTELGSHTLHVLLVCCALGYFGLSRLADHFFARSVQLPSFFGQGGSRITAEQLKNLLWLVAVRAMARVLLGMAAFSGPFNRGAVGVAKLSDQVTVRQAFESIPPWVWFAISALCPCIMFLGATITRRAEADVREGRLD